MYKVFTRGMYSDSQGESLTEYLNRAELLGWILVTIIPVSKHEAQFVFRKSGTAELTQQTDFPLPAKDVECSEFSFGYDKMI